MSLINNLNEILQHAEKNPKPNFTQYQLAVAEVTSSHRARQLKANNYPESMCQDSEHEADAYRLLRRQMERLFGLASLDAVAGV